MNTQTQQPPTLTRSEQARINGAKSKGPTSPDGKAKSSQNALKHGFAAKINVLIRLEDAEAWHAHLAGYRDSFHPTNHAETDLVDQLASISWRQARLTHIETALIDFQISIQNEKVEEYHPYEKDNNSFLLVLAWQGLARKAFTAPIEDPTVPPDGLDIQSIELVRRYQVSLDRQYRNVLLNLRQLRKDFASPQPPPQSPQPEQQQNQKSAGTNEPDKPQPQQQQAPPPQTQAPQPTIPQQVEPGNIPIHQPSTPPQPD